MKIKYGTFQIQFFQVGKAGNRRKECEDAFYCHYCPESKKLSVAIADGASDSYASRRWARLLVREFATDPVEDVVAQEIERRLQTLSMEWKSRIDWKNLEWYKVEKARRGAFSTLLVLQFDFSNQLSRSWRAWAIGDTCLFHIRDGSLAKVFPIETPEEFNTTPALLSTDLGYNSASLDHLKVWEGEYEQGDVFLLGTDAIAEWSLNVHAKSKAPWKELQAAGTTEFVKLIDSLRSEHAIRNDDVTMIKVVIGQKSHTNKVELSPSTSVRAVKKRPKKLATVSRSSEGEEQSPEHESASRLMARYCWIFLVLALLLLLVIVSSHIDLFYSTNPKYP